jgi:hypothetical protein
VIYGNVIRQPRWGCLIIVGFPKAGDVVASLSAIGNGFAVATFHNYTRWDFRVWFEDIEVRF